MKRPVVAHTLFFVEKLQRMEQKDGQVYLRQDVDEQIWHIADRVIHRPED
jgi:hypothetical protein